MRDPDGDKWGIGDTRWQLVLIGGTLAVAAGVGFFVEFYRWLGYSKTSEAIGHALIVFGILPWAVALRRRIWAYRAPESLGFRIAIYSLVVLSIIAFPTGVMLVNSFFRAQHHLWKRSPTLGFRS